MSSLIFQKMNSVMKDIGYIGKDQKNTVQGFRFRGVDQFVNALYPALTRHGVFMTPRAVQFTQDLKDVTRSNGKAGVDKHVAIMMEYDFYAEDGSKVTVGPVPAEGLDSGDKATNKALSAALKYALIQTFSIPTEDMAEADFESPELGRTNKGSPEKSQSSVTSTSGPTTPDNSIKATKPVAIVADVQATLENPTAAQTPVAPLKKSSFRKPKATPLANGHTDSSQENGWT